MIAAFNSSPILDDKGKPVHGRFYVFEKDTNQPATVYLYDKNNSLIEGSNPIYTDIYGYPEYDVILDDNIYSVSVERYNGNYSDPKQDDRTTMWEIVNGYYVGQVREIPETPDTIYGINSLASADITKEFVDVIGYYNAFDCEKRTYVWDQLCIAQPDSGYILKSNYTNTGRWVLLNDLPWVPSEYYGVYPGSTSNINNLVSMPVLFFGTNTYHVPNAIKFVSGSYQLARNLSLSNSRSIIVDNATTFIGNYNINCNGITRLGERKSDGIGKLKLPASSEAKLSWFTTYEAFLTCGSKNLHVDCEFAANQLDNPIVLNNVSIYLEGFNLNVTYGTRGMLTFDDCAINGYSFGLGISNNVKYQNMPYTDKYLVINETENAVIGTNCTLTASDFIDIEKYAKAVIATGNYIFNLDGRAVSSDLVISDSSNVDKTLITVKNGTLNSVQLVISGTGNRVVVVENGGFKMALNSTYANVSFVATNSALTLNNIRAKSIDARDCTFTQYCHADNVSLTKCVVVLSTQATTQLFANACTFNSKVSSDYEIGMYNSVCNGVVTATNTVIENSRLSRAVKPVVYTLNGNNYIRASILNCVLDTNNTSDKAAIVLEPKSDEYDVILDQFHVQNCTFIQTVNNDGIYVKLYNGSDGDTNRFFINKNSSLHTWSWEGNTGKCLQKEYNVLRAFSNNTSTLDNIRLIHFGFSGVNKGVSYPVDPYTLEAKLIDNSSNIVAYYYMTQDTYSTIKMYPYSTADDYFLHRITSSGLLNAGTYSLLVKPLRRFVNRDMI